MVMRFPKATQSTLCSVDSASIVKVAMGRCTESASVHIAMVAFLKKIILAYTCGKKLTSHFFWGGVLIF